MLEIAGKLPIGALIGGEDRLLSQSLLRTNGARFIARQADVVMAEGTITGWREAQGAVVAEAAGPNTGNSRFDAGPPGAMLCESGKNCGFVLPAFAPRVERFTAAVILTSQGEARTLLSVSTGQSNNLIFLSESEGQLVAKDREGAVEVSLPLAQTGRARLAVLGFDGRKLWLSCGGQTVVAEGRVPGMDHPGEFFIGCRSNRAGLVKTLGSSRLHEVMFWPDRALQGSDEPDDRAALGALGRYMRWVW
ncbi:MAG: hypothetical protein C0524_14370 [Rhodobacter sp.]|nr:hypothetical protein [Rhodobacter sp.]